ncbi:MAG: hypothetical protein ACRDI2_08595 [Chloroflexota bacterium]
MGLLDRLFGGIAEQRRQREEEAARREYELRDSHLKELMEEFAEAEHITAKPYHELSVGEAKLGKTPAVEYLHNSSAVRLYNLMTMDHMREAALIDAMGMRLDDLPEGEEVGELIDVKPQDMAAIEHGGVNLGPVEEFKGAAGQRWRFFIELSYSAAAGSGRGGIMTRYFIVDCPLT